MSYRRNRTFVVAWLIALLVALAALALPAAGEAADSGSISGTVTNLSDEPVEQVNVCAYELEEGHELEEGCVYTAADGTYEIDGLGPGNYTVIFWFYGENGIHFFHGARSEAAATLVPVTSGQVTGSIDEKLDITDTSGALASISGTVTAGPTGRPLPGATVCAIKVGGGGIYCQATDAAGRYSIKNVGAGTWSVYFFGDELEPEYMNQAWHERSEPEQPDPLVLDDGTNATGIDAVLWPGGQIAGIVRSVADGAPLGDIRVCLVEAASGDPLGCEYTAGDGSYGFEALPPGAYKVAFSPEMVEIYGRLVTELEEEAEEVLFPPDGYATAWWNGAPSFAAATPINIVDSATIGGVDDLLAGSPTEAGSRPSDGDGGSGGGSPFIFPGDSRGSPPGAAFPPSGSMLPPVSHTIPKPTRCPHGFVKRVSKGKTRCVRIHKVVKHKPHHKKHA